jgi:leucine-rich repeat protein SHOC2
MGNKALAAQLRDPKVKKQEVIDLRKKQIQQLPSAISGLHCKTFLVSENDLTELPEDIAKMSNLEVLEANLNRINGLPPEIGNCPRLRELYLRQNKLFVHGYKRHETSLALCVWIC